MLLSATTLLHFQSKVLRSRRQILRPKRDDSINLIIGKNRPLFQCLRGSFGAAGGWLWLFCRKFCGFWSIFGQDWRCCRIRVTLPPPHRHKCGPAVNAPVMKRLPELRLVLLGALAALFSELLHVVGVRPLRFLAEESRRRPTSPPLPENAVWIDLVKPTARGGQGGGAAGRDRGADPRGHAGDRDFQPALYRERRALHDRDADVPFRHRHAADHGGHLHPRRSSPGNRALRRAEAVCAGREQAGADHARPASPAKWC